jgi:hypothetical protein
MRSFLLALALTVVLLGLPAAPAARAAELDGSTAVEAIIVVGESDLSALLDSGLLGEHAFVSAADVGLDPADLAGALRFNEDSVLTPEQLGLDTPDWGFFGPRFTPFFAGFRTIGVPVFVPRVVPVAVPLPVAVPAPIAVPLPVPVLAFRPVFVRPPVLFPRFPVRFVGRVIVIPGF